MYRDDTCAMCGESLPPDHLYCREHAATVDDRLHDIAALLPRVTEDVARLAALLSSIHEETWEFLAEAEPENPEWPPNPLVSVTADAEDIDIDVDTEPGMVQVRMQVPAATVLAAVAGALDQERFARFAEVIAKAHGLNATH